MLRSEFNTNMKYIKGMLAFVGCLAILVIVGLGIRYNWKHITDWVLGLTAAIILWYTWETSRIRTANEIIAQANRETSEKNKKPIIAYNVNTHPNYI